MVQCLQIAKRVALEKVECSNFAISPAIIHASLSLIAAGSTGPALSFANCIGVPRHFHLKPRFRELAYGQYGTDAKQFVYETRGIIKEMISWIDKATKGLVKDVLPCWVHQLQNQTCTRKQLYFKGMWNQRFDPSQTQGKVFHLLNGDTVQVPFMTSHKGESHFFRSFQDFKILKLSYQNGLDSRRFSMEEELDDFAIPRFNISIRFEASNIITELGLLSPFLDLEELSEMVHCTKGLYVSNIFHSSCIEVNEYGTKAAPSTSWILESSDCCLTLSPPTFVADHPFLFKIREETSRMVLLTGALLNPSLVS